MRLSVNHALPLAALVLISGCQIGGGARPDSAPLAGNGPAADYPVVFGDPFTIAGTTYTPSDRLNHDEVGYASLARDGGEGVSIAHKTLPVPSYAEVTTLDSGKTILVRVERRGPMTNERIAELSPGAAAQLGVAGQDKPAVRIRRVNPPEIERAALRGGQRAPARIDTPQGLLSVLRRKLEPQGHATAGLPAMTAPTPLPAPSPRTSDVPAPTPSATPARTATPIATPTPKPSPRPRAVPTPRPGTSPAPRAIPSPRPSASAAAGSYIVQIGTFSLRQNADAAASKTGGQARQGGNLWRVRMGPFATRAAAEAAMAKARAAGYRDAQIQRAN